MRVKISNMFQLKYWIVAILLINIVFTTHLHGSQIHWEPIGFGAGGLFLVIAVDPVETNVVYVGADVSGLYKSVDYGESWKHINVGLGSREIASFTINPSNHLHLWAGTPMGLYSSQNGGESWSLVSPDIRCFKQANHKGITISPNGQTILVASHYLEGDADAEEGGFSGKLYRSSDGGASWAVVQEFSGKRIPSVMFDPYTPEQAFLLVAGQGILRSTDGGQTWEDFSKGLPSKLNWKNRNYSGIRSYYKNKGYEF